MQQSCRGAGSRFTGERWRPITAADWQGACSRSRSRGGLKGVGEKTETSGIDVGFQRATRKRLAETRETQVESGKCRAGSRKARDRVRKLRAEINEIDGVSRNHPGCRRARRTTPGEDAGLSTADLSRLVLSRNSSSIGASSTERVIEAGKASFSTGDFRAAAVAENDARQLPYAEELDPSPH